MDTLDGRLSFLLECKKTHFEIAQKFHGIPAIDHLTYMVLNRSLSLVFGYVQLIRAKNYGAAAPLIRCQIDNLLRFRAAFLHKNIHAFMIALVQGDQINKMTDATGMKMTDKYLRDVLKPEFPWLEDAYTSSSGYIHLSDKHLLNTISIKKDDPRNTPENVIVESYIGPDDKNIPEDVYLGTTELMIQITYELLKTMFKKLHDAYSTHLK